MFRKTMLSGDEELGKKDDDHRFKPIRQSSWSIWGHSFRWRRRRIVLAMVGLLLVYYLLHGTADDVDSFTPQQYPSTLGRPTTSTYTNPSADQDEPTGAPEGIQRSVRGEPTPHGYDGQVRFFRLASSLRSSASTTGGYDKKNRNILFAISALQSASVLLSMACDMSKWNRNHVHVAFMGRDGIPLEDLLEINGIDKTECPAMWHDARPDYAEYSTDSRAESAVKGALSHIDYFLHPQAVIIHDTLSEDGFFVRGMRSKTDTLHMALIEVPKDRLDDFTWVTRLDAGSLKRWHDPTIDILIQVPPYSSSVLQLLKSIKDADYSGLRPPHITLELPAQLDRSVEEYITKFKWPPSSNEHYVGSGLTVRRRIANHGSNQEESAIRFLELFYPASSTNSHVLLLSSQTHVARQYFHFVKYALLEYKYSAFGTHDSGDLMGVSLELPTKLLDNQAKLKLPSTSDMHTDRYKKLYPEAKSAPFLWQAPNSHATLFFGGKWAEFHSFLSNRVVKRQDSVKWTPRAKLVSETLPAWSEYMLEFMRARGYSLLYPAIMPSEIVTIHKELYQTPEEFSASLEDANGEAQAVRKNEAFQRAGTRPGVPNGAETKATTDAQPLHLVLPFDGDLPEIPHLPLLLYNGQQMDAANVSTIAQAYAEQFRKEVGGCETIKGKHRKRVEGQAGDLFCFGSEGREDWEEDETRETELFDAPIDDQLEKLLVDGLPTTTALAKDGKPTRTATGADSA
ncbi:hypothetical protein yc1106_05999 [Curvularia clavata]|uniref:Glycosyltransferase 2 n=1 Tax=Curvularia clavata TaxID=95742 RepID=A0A9Q8ZBK5_CURCL|nr:hypothetical protein yc1106_05999 [Curvularia clavata]